MNYSPVVPTSINFLEKEIKIYPNPIQDGAFKIESQCEEIVGLTIFDAMGRFVPFSRESHSCLELIHLHSVNPGFYFVQIELRNGGYRHYKVLAK